MSLSQNQSSLGAQSQEVISLIQALRESKQGADGSVKSPTDKSHAVSLLKALGLPSPIPIGDFEAAITRARQMLQPRSLKKAGVPEGDAKELQGKLAAVYQLLSNPKTRKEVEMLVGPLSISSPIGIFDKLTLPKSTLSSPTAEKKAANSKRQSSNNDTLDNSKPTSSARSDRKTERAETKQKQTTPQYRPYTSSYDPPKPEPLPKPKPQPEPQPAPEPDKIEKKPGIASKVWGWIKEKVAPACFAVASEIAKECKAAIRSTFINLGKAFYKPVMFALKGLGVITAAVVATTVLYGGENVAAALENIEAVVQGIFEKFFSR